MVVRYVFTEIDLKHSCQSPRRWLVERPELMERDGYRSLVSISSFMHGSRQNCYKGKKRGPRKHKHVPPRAEYLYHGQLLDEYEWTRRNWNSVKYGELYPTIDSMLVCESVWEFYRQIGFDHKKKRYINKE